MSKFWTFIQNNSGGRFMVDDNVSEIVIIEGHNIIHANERAEEVGLYFDGDGDCPCCGNRWSDMWDENEGTETPTVYDSPAKEFKSHFFNKKITIHYLNGQKEQFDALVGE